MKKGILLAHRTHFSDCIWSSWDPTWKTQRSQPQFFRKLVFYFPVLWFLLFFPWFLAYPWEICVLLQHSSQGDTLGFRGASKVKRSEVLTAGYYEFTWSKVSPELLALNSFNNCVETERGEEAERANLQAVLQIWMDW